MRSPCSAPHMGSHVPVQLGRARMPVGQLCAADAAHVALVRAKEARHLHAGAAGGAGVVCLPAFPACQAHICVPGRLAVVVGCCSRCRSQLPAGKPWLLQL